MEGCLFVICHSCLDSRALNNGLQALAEILFIIPYQLFETLSGVVVGRFGLEEAILSEESRSTAGPMVSDLVLRKAAAGEELRRQNRRHSRQHRSTPMANLSLHRCEGKQLSHCSYLNTNRAPPIDLILPHW